MLLRQVLEAERILCGPATGMVDRLRDRLQEGRQGDVKFIVPQGGETTFVIAHFAGTAGRLAGGSTQTLGVIGQLGGMRMDSVHPCMLSDGDGAVAAVALMLKLAEMERDGLRLKGDVTVSTHLCTEAKLAPRKPVDFVAMPIDCERMQRILVTPEMDAVVSIDTSRGNRLLNASGIALTPVAKEGWILPVAEGLIDIAQWVTGRLAQTLPLCTQDLTPYTSGVRHVNSIMQPSTVTHAPVVGLAVGAEGTVPGTAANAGNCQDIEQAARFCLETALRLGEEPELFYDRAEFFRLQEAYGTMERIQRA